MAAYYNDSHPYAVAWLRALIREGLLPAGDVDDRDIRDVCLSDLRGYRQCHFFAGMGGWPLILEQMGWPENRQIWTGSCPCQSISSAGQRNGSEDKRHLWPEFFRLIEAFRPRVVIGEQVSGGLGAEWLAAVFMDLEEADYAIAGADLPAATAGAPHIRQRLWFGASAGDATAGWPIRPKGWITQSQGMWDRAIKVPCTDGKTRRIREGLVPLALPSQMRLEQLKAIGNAVVPSVGGLFLRAWLSAEGDVGSAAALRRHKRFSSRIWRKAQPPQQGPVARFRGHPNAAPGRCIDGPLFSGWEKKHPLQQRLDQILMEQISEDASPECRLMWRDCIVPGRDPIPRLNAKLRADGELGIWQTPKASDGFYYSPRTTGRPMHRATHLQTQVLAVLGGAQDRCRTNSNGNGQLPLLSEGSGEHDETSHSPAFPLGSKGTQVMDPTFPLWLMGYPQSWLNCAPLDLKGDMVAQEPKGGDLEAEARP